ncbi:hypothetical protein P7K49_025742 [Saguinus oedipus]|uniref:Uncharacterized protein n=1 Tax=Saguinus oedipus TaxID=9490 RepID=A0ABQ9UI07_SAGOE|nr:hypothetical protein P7K49_025742 [Saguinus oedipus]
MEIISAITYKECTAPSTRSACVSLCVHAWDASSCCDCIALSADADSTVSEESSERDAGDKTPGAINDGGSHRAPQSGLNIPNRCWRHSEDETNVIAVSQDSNV